MEKRNLDFNVDLTREQWLDLGRTAEAVGARGGGYGWDEDRELEIRVYLSDDDAPNLWRNLVADEGTYGATRREIAQFHFNGGRPYAEVHLPEGLEEPILTEQEQQVMRDELDGWLRDKWHALLRDSGQHYDRGHLPQG